MCSVPFIPAKKAYLSAWFDPFLCTPTIELWEFPCIWFWSAVYDLGFDLRHQLFKFPFCAVINWALRATNPGLWCRSFFGSPRLYTVWNCVIGPRPGLLPLILLFAGNWPLICLKAVKLSNEKSPEVHLLVAFGSDVLRTQTTGYFSHVFCPGKVSSVNTQHNNKFKDLFNYLKTCWLCATTLTSALVCPLKNAEEFWKCFGPEQIRPKHGAVGGVHFKILKVAPQHTTNPYTFLWVPWKVSGVRSLSTQSRAFQRSQSRCRRYIVKYVAKPLSPVILQECVHITYSKIFQGHTFHVFLSF